MSQVPQTAIADSPSLMNLSFQNPSGQMDNDWWAPGGWISQTCPVVRCRQRADSHRQLAVPIKQSGPDLLIGLAAKAGGSALRVPRTAGQR